MGTRNYRKSFNILIAIILLVGLLLTATPLQPAQAADFTAGTNAELVAAIVAANGTTEADTITLTADITITGAALPSIDDQITIEGAGYTLDVASGEPWRVLDVTATGDLTLNQITIANGNAGALGGGAIVRSSGSLTVNNSTFIGNQAGNTGGGIHNDGTTEVFNSTFEGNQAEDSGGGIYNAGTTEIFNSTFTGNAASGASADGGGITNWFGALTVSNSTISNNMAVDAGGGLGIVGGTASIYNSTISENTGASGGGVYNRDPIAFGVITNFVNTIIANSTAGGDCVDIGASVSGSSNNNLIQDNANACGLTNGVNGNVIGTAPNLGTLADNGGPTQTFALLFGSPAIDAGDNTSCAAAPINNLDQRGIARPTDGDGDSTATCDIGAYEAGEMQCGLSVATAYTFNSQGGVSIYVTSLGTNLDCLYVDQKPTNHPNATGTAGANGIMTGNFWTIEGLQAGGTSQADEDFDVDITFLWASADTNSRGCRYTGGAGAGWDCGDDAANDFVSNISVTRTEVGSFSDWAVGQNVNPTAVALTTLSAQNAGGIGLIALTGLLILGGVFVWKRKR